MFLCCKETMGLWEQHGGRGGLSTARGTPQNLGTDGDLARPAYAEKGSD